MWHRGWRHGSVACSFRTVSRTASIAGLRIYDGWPAIGGVRRSACRRDVRADDGAGGDDAAGAGRFMHCRAAVPRCRCALWRRSMETRLPSGTPVPGGGFSEESHDPSRSARLWFQSGDKPSEDAMPPLFVVAEDALPFRPTACIYPRSASVRDRQNEKTCSMHCPRRIGASGLRVAMEAALAKPRERTVEPALANLLPFDDQSDSEPAISVGRSWDASDISTGDTEPRTPAAPASDSALPVVPPVVVEPVAPFPLATASDSEIWDGAPTVDAEKPIVTRRPTPSWMASTPNRSKTPGLRQAKIRPRARASSGRRHEGPFFSFGADCTRRCLRQVN